MPGETSRDLGDLWVAINDATKGALYDLRYRCRENQWTPRMWAQTTEEGAPKGCSRFLFLGVDDKGIARYFNSALVPDPNGLAKRLRQEVVLREAKLATQRIQEGLARMDHGQDPVPEENARAVLALN